MKVFSFCRANPSQEKVQNLLKLEWFNSEDQWEFLDDRLLLNIQEGYLGIDPRKIESLIEAGGGVVLIEKRLAVKSNNTNDSIWFDDNLLVLSTSNMNGNIPNIIEIGLYLCRWRLRKEITCTNECVFNNILYDKSEAICSDCEDLLCQLNFGKDAVNIKSLLSLRKKNSMEIENLLNLHIAEALPKLNLTLGSSKFKINAAKTIIDYHLKSGTVLRNWLKKTSNKVYKQKQKMQEKYKSGRHNLPKTPFFIASRRWNSWTPNLPRIRSKTHHYYFHKKNGGGYFVSDGAVNIVIDPGYGFLDMLNSFHDISVMDIDAIIITHDHPDHSSELQNILSLRFVYKSECSSKLRIFLNPSTFYLYRNLLSYYSELLHNNRPMLVVPGGDPIIFNKIEINTIGMHHNEIYNYLYTDIKNKVDSIAGESKALGLKVSINTIEEASCQIAIPGDTSFPENPEEVERLAEFYGNPDIASVHLGSIEEEWSSIDTDPASKIDYGQGKHLGLNGVVKFLNIIQPKVAIISEFGEELNASDIRLSISELTKDLLLYKDIIILPSDFRLFLLLKSDSIFFKCKCGEFFVPIEKVGYSIDKEHFIDYSFKAGCKSKLAHYKFRA